MDESTSLPPGSPTAVPTIRLQSILLRPITFDDGDFVRASATDPYVCRISSVPSPCTDAGAREFIERQHQRLPEGAGYPLVIEPLDPAEGGAVGFVGMWFREFASNQVATFGYWSIERARGKGYMGEALRGLSDWAFAKVACDRHRLWIEEWNVASQKTGERAGFVSQPGVRQIEELDGLAAEVQAWDRVRSES